MKHFSFLILHYGVLLFLMLVSKTQGTAIVHNFHWNPYFHIYRNPRSANFYCGKDYFDSLDCHHECPSGQNTDCPFGEVCFAGVICDTGATDRYCGTSWAHAQESCALACPYGTEAECPSGQTCFGGVDCTEGKSPPPSVTIPPSDFVAYYELTWTIDTPLHGADVGIAFSGWADVSKALIDSSTVYYSLPPTKYISIGGGVPDTGAWSAGVIDALNEAIKSGETSDYNGICYDIEEGDHGLASKFEESFRLAKSKGYQVFVTVSHSCPYGISDGPQVMEAILSSSNVDYVSPQLYTTGTETSNDYTADRVPWSAYANRTPKIVVSITETYLYADAVQEFAKHGVSLYGYTIWP